MKQKLMLIGCLFLLMFTSCKKEVFEETQNAEEMNAAMQGSTDAGSRFGKCRLTSAIRDNVYGEFLQYNNRGLVSEWKEDYFDGYPYVINYEYDFFGRLKSAHVTDNFSGLSTDVKYKYQGNRLIKQTIYEAGTNNILNEIVNTYNNQGQIIKRGSTMFPVYCTFTYNWMGNNPLVNYYVDGFLLLKEEFAYLQFNRNPFLAAHGIPYVTYRYDFLFSKWWQTSEKYTVYDNGVATVTLDLDPSTVEMTLGAQQYLTSVSNVDRLTGQTTSAYFSYDNCRCEPGRKFTIAKPAPRSTAARLVALAKFKRSFEMGDVNKIKAQFREFSKK